LLPPEKIKHKEEKKLKVGEVKITKARVTFENKHQQNLGGVGGGGGVGSKPEKKLQKEIGQKKNIKDTGTKKKNLNAPEGGTPLPKKNRAQPPFTRGEGRFAMGGKGKFRVGKGRLKCGS